MAEAITLARPYAKAAFEFAVANGSLDAWSVFLKTAAVVSLDPSVCALLIDPRISVEQLIALYDFVCAKTMNEAHKNFLHLLANNRRLKVMPEILSLFENLRADYEKTVDIDVRTYMPLNEAQEEQLKHALKNRLQRDVALHIHIDESLLGGVVIRAKDLVIDGSVRRKLSRLAEDMGSN